MAKKTKFKGHGNRSDNPEIRGNAVLLKFNYYAIHNR